MKVEPFALSFYRNIHHHHPVFMLMHPYLQYAIPMAVSAKSLWCSDDNVVVVDGGGNTQNDVHASIASLLFGIKKEHIAKMKKKLFHAHPHDQEEDSYGGLETTKDSAFSKGKEEKKPMNDRSKQRIKSCRDVIDTLMCDKRWIQRGMVFHHNNGSGITGMLPSYPFREDSLLLWSAIEDHTSAFVEQFYSNDDTIRNDYELQSFWKETMQQGYNVRDVEGQCVLHTKTDLQDLLAGLIYVSTIEFCAHTTQCWKSYSNPLLTPLSLRHSAPINMEVAMQVTQTDFVECLPKTATSLVGAAFMQLLSMHQGLGKPMMSMTWTTEQELLVRKYKQQEQFFVNYIRLHKRFISALEIIEEVIKERNQSRSTPYEALLPSKIKRGMAA